jgi:hypothetical protein
MSTQIVDTVIDALHAVRFVRQHYASGPDSVKRIKDITSMLREAGKNTETRSLVAFADAIEKM